MMDNQAFGWLKKSIMGGGGDNSSSGIDEDIANCTDPSILVNGIAHDFKMLLLLSNSSNSSTTDIAPPPDTKLSISSAAVASEGSSAAAIVDATQSKLSSDGAPKSISTNNHSDNLTARLDRIKTLLYEERSASSNSVTQNGGVINLNWVPAIATGVFKSFTLSTQSATSDEVANDTASTSDDISSKSAAPVSDYEKLNTNELIPTILQNLPLLQFEARKSISAIFNYLLVCGIDGNDSQSFTSVSTAFAKYVLDRGDVIIGQLVNGHNCSEVVVNKNGMSGSGMKGSVLEAAASSAAGSSGGGGSCVDITLLCGSMLRSSIRHANIYQYILSNEHCSKLVYPFFDQFVHNPNFDVSSDALETVRVMLSGMSGGSNQQVAAAGMVGDAASEEYKQLMESIASDFLNRKYTEIIDERINKKCLSSSASYMTRRMSLQLLSTILLNRVNYNVMMMYISSSKNLVIILCLLRDPSPHITLDAFQVFKIFVANPNKVSGLLLCCVCCCVCMDRVACF